MERYQIIFVTGICVDSRASLGERTVSNNVFHNYSSELYCLFRWFCEPAYEKLRGTEEGTVNRSVHELCAYVAG